MLSFSFRKEIPIPRTPLQLEGMEISDVRHSTWCYIKKHYLGRAILLVALSLVVIVRFPLIGFGLLGSVFTFYLYISQKVASEFVRRFGESIGFTYEPHAHIAGTPGTSFSFSDGGTVLDVLSGSYDGLPVRIYTYSFKAASGDSSHEFFFTVFECTFESRMPEVILQTNPYMGSNPYNLFLFQALTLEGDFSSRFKVYAAKGYETEAYELLTPDIMAKLMDVAKGLNFEFKGNKMYIYVPTKVQTAKGMRDMFVLADEMIKSFKRNISEIQSGPAVPPLAVPLPPLSVDQAIRIVKDSMEKNDSDTARIGDAIDALGPRQVVRMVAGEMKGKTIGSLILVSVITVAAVAVLFNFF